MADKLAGGIKAGSVDVSVGFVLRKTADNTEQTGKVAADMTLSYWRQGGLRVAITASDLAAVDSVHSDGGVKEVDATNLPGLYRLDLPDAAVATGADAVTVGVKVAANYLFFERFALTTNVVQTGDSFARLGAPAGASLAADVATRMATFTLPTNFSALSITAGGLVDLTQAAADKVWSTTTRTLSAFSTALALSVWDVLETAIATASSIGLKVKTNLDVVLSTRLPAALVGGRMDSDLKAIDGDAAMATRFKESVTAIFKGSVTGATTTTTLIDSTLTQADADHWKGRVILFITGTLKYQGAEITAFDPATDRLTFNALTQAPANGDQYVVV